ncbi:chemotaxis protein CheA [Granulicella sp. dw_53]|uniref:chemotaxis protein CheA n=1 Tax=Granulicella sp. dw_53 TaxID=2719792 RepID=UPI0021069B22|nr:chemotaxis protein CheA [Granulicella sp. dw_53]
MSAPSENAELTSLMDQLDDLSTRLILDGVGADISTGLQRLSETAAERGSNQIAMAARLLYERTTASAEASVPELTESFNSGLMELREMIERDANEAADAQRDSAGSIDESEVAEAGFDSLAVDEDLVLEFITESREHLSHIESQMLELERDNSAAETLNAVFRAFHTIKGLAGFLEFTAIQALAHEVETLLDRARTAQLVVTPLVVDVVLESTDVVRHELTGIEQRMAGRAFEPSNVNEALLQRIRDVAEGETVHAPAEESELDPSASALSVPKPALSPELVPPGAFDEVQPMEGSTRTVARRASDTSRAVDASSLRIDTAKLDQLMDMVGEMVIAQTLIGHSPALASVTDPRLLSDLMQLARITADVQKVTTGMRMVPIGAQFSKTARLIRDLSRRAGKQIVLETSGEDTELDKTIAEELSDPLLHMVRNSIDHGIEPPEERIALGKDPTARIRISAYHQSGQIVIAISDDGRGLNREKILAKAQQNGLIQSGAQLSDNEIFLLIFEPGFSTAEKITDISGRGVGMDVVRKHVQKLRGRIDIQSKQGEGTTFYLKLPLTLAIIEGLVVVVGMQRYIVPIFSVREMFRPTAEMLSTVQGTGEMVMVRGGLMPVVRLHRLFRMEARTDRLDEGVLIVAESQGKHFCLFVDDLVGKQEVVIKSLGRSFQNIAGVAGCAILGDGRVGLILDVEGLYKARA